MKKHVLLMLLSGSVLALAACGSQESSSGSTSEGSNEQSSSGKPAAQLANGAFSYQYNDGDDRTEILGLLEKYAVENKLTGLTLYGDGGYVMYNPGIVKGSPTYIPGYGFGILGEGSINQDLEGETNPAWKRYLHTYEAEDPLKINYMDDKGSVVGDLIGYVSGSYFGNFMNETKDGYDWVGDLSPVNRPIAVNPNENGFTATYRVEVKVGADLKYSTSSEKYAKYNNREVQLEDYITPYKIYYTQAYGMARGSENLTGSGSIKGASKYYNGSKDGFKQDLWNDIGIKPVTEGDKSYIEFTFNAMTTRFYAMYYLASSMFAPVPEEFITEIGGGNFATGVKNWGVFSDNGETIVDHWLCTGPYMFERWDKGQQIVFKRNPNRPDDKHYKIEGIHVNILTAAQDDPEAGFKEFLANKLHSVGIPSTQLEKYRDDPRTTMTSDSSTYKLNLNTCDEKTWEDLFGENGSITRTAKEDYWDVEPAMNNKDFVSGLSFALDRLTLANTIGRTPSGNYFGNAYMSDPESGIAYNNTDAHKNAVKELMAGTDGYGFSLEKAKASFQKAAEDLIAAGVYEEGDTVEIEIAWQTQAQVTREHALLSNMLTSAFNTDENPLTLKVNSWVGASWSDVYYNKMMLGQFDIGFGSISGNTLNPLNFLEVLKSDNSSGFTLNWGLDTNNVEKTIEWDDKLWSFDALWTAADQGAYVVGGQNTPLFDFAPVDLEVNASGEAELTVAVREVIVPSEGSTEEDPSFDALGVFYGALLYGQNTADDYEESALYAVGTDAVEEIEFEDDYFTTAYKITFAKEDVEKFNAFTGKLGVDIYYAKALLGADSEITFSGSIGLEPGSLVAAAE